MKYLSAISFLAIVFCLTAICGFAQQRVVYLDSLGFEATAANYKYKRVIKYKEPIVIPIFETGYYGDRTARVKETGFHYCTVTEYLKTGELWMVGKAISADVGCTKLDGYDGQVVYYYENGDIARKEPWQYGKKHGVVITYERDGSEIETLREEYVKGERIDTSKFSASADSPITGTWKYVEYGTTKSLYDGSTSSYVKRTSTYIYSQNGVVESIHQDIIRTNRIKGNWKYIPKTASSGILEEYLGDDLVERATVKFSSRNQLEYTITFSQNSDLVGKQSVWTRQ